MTDWTTLIGFGLLLAGALACLLWPLWRRPGGVVPTDSVAANLAAFRAREQELGEWLTRGEIDAVQHRTLHEEAQQLLALHVADATKADTDRPGGGWLLGLVGLLILTLALTGYQRLGAAPDLALRNALVQTDGDIDALIDQLRERVAARPDNATYALVLARFEQQRGRLPQALTAYEALLERAPDLPEVRAEYAQALFLAADNQVTEQVRAQTERVLAAQPDNGVALGLRGIDAFQREAYAEAIAAWQQVLATAPVEAEAVANAIAAARARLGADAPPPLLRVAVTLGDSAPVDPETPVFVLVREWQGPPQPVVARRLRAGDLPVELSFETTSSLLPGRPLASIAQYEVVARLSPTGTPEPSPNDREARAGPFAQAPEGRLVELRLEP